MTALRKPRLLRALTWFTLLAFCGGCASSSSLATKGFAKLSRGRIPAAEKKFEKSIAKDPGNVRAVYGLCLVRRAQDNTLGAIELCRSAAQRDPKDGEVHLTLGELHADQLDYATAIEATRVALHLLKGDNGPAIYNLARFHTVIGETSEAVDLLRLFYDRPSVLPTYQARARREADFFNLRAEPGFQRWLSNLRRLKLSILGARAGYNDIFDNASDAYVSVTYDGKLLLYTDVIDDDPSPEWSNDYVIFDYRLGDTINLTLMDHDISEDDYLGGLQLWDLKPSYGWYQNLIRLQVEDSEESVWSTGYRRPANISPLAILIGAGIAVAYMSSQDELEARTSAPTSYQPSSGTIATKLLSCAAQQGVSSLVGNPLAAGAIAEALASGLEDREYSLGSAAKGAVVGHVTDALRRGGREDLAQAVGAGDLLLCALGALR